MCRCTNPYTSCDRFDDCVNADCVNAGWPDYSCSCLAPTGTNSGGTFRAERTGRGACAKCRVCGAGEEEARAPDPPPPTVDEAAEPARAPDPPIEDEATLSIAATRTMVTVETQTPIQTQKPAANPTSAKKQRPARKPAPPEAELAALDAEVKAQQTSSPR